MSCGVSSGDGGPSSGAAYESGGAEGNVAGTGTGGEEGPCRERGGDEEEDAADAPVPIPLDDESEDVVVVFEDCRAADGFGMGIDGGGGELLPFGCETDAPRTRLGGLVPAWGIEGADVWR